MDVSVSKCLLSVNKDLRKWCREVSRRLVYVDVKKRVSLNFNLQKQEVGVKNRVLYIPPTVKEAGFNRHLCYKQAIKKKIVYLILYRQKWL